MLYTNSKQAFTMLELVFVIVVLGILASIAIPKFTATRTDAQISKGRADISAIRSAIVTERQTRLIKGDSNWINALSHSPYTTLFDGNGTVSLLMYGIKPGATDGHWSRTGANAYIFHVGGKDCTFTYDGAGKFDIGNTADDNSTICQNLVN